MKPFMDDDFLLQTQTARTLFHEHAMKMPIIDYHNHLNPQEIYEDFCYDNMAQVWLGADHYKWRALRANGVPEELVTGNGDPFKKFLAWADTVQNCIGNPLYHWTHLELQRYFHITETLSPATAKDIWETCNAKLKEKTYSVRNLLRMQNVKVLCTTDDPADDLKYHRLLAKECPDIRVLPTFRPERALGIDKPDFADYLKKLAAVCEKDEINSIEDLISCLTKRLAFFKENGCVVSDHSLEGIFYVACDKDKADSLLKKRMTGVSLTEEECGMYRGYVLTELGKAYAKEDLAMQLHIGALRSNSKRMFRLVGPDTGFDSLHDFNYAPQLSALLNAMDESNELPKTILYYLNPKDAEMLAAMAGNFQGNDKGIRGKVQLGSAWWFCDHKNGMEHQLDTLADTGLLSCFVGMLTDSRSFLSYPRHEYFRRILCNKIGNLVENGEYPCDMDYLGKLVEDICYNNAVDYFGL